MRILIDMDNVLYDIHKPWIEMHNRESTVHQVTMDSYVEWDMSKVCKAANCDIDIYKYLNEKAIWNTGPIIEGALAVINKWKMEDHKLAVVTAVGNTVAPNRKLSWLQNNFPMIDNVFITYGKNKDWIIGDILIDDAIHNIEYFNGISIIFDQPWNRSDGFYPRAKDWKHLEKIVTRAEKLITKYNHKFVERILYTEIEEGNL